MNKSFDECARFVSAKFDDPLYLSKEESQFWVRKILTNSSIELGVCQEAAYNVMMRKKPKLNTLFLHGESHAGKSVLMRGLRDGFQCFGSMTKSETFGFQDCVDRQVNVNEEMLIGPQNVDRFKQLAEGGVVKVDVKMKEPVIIARTPLIVCSNTAPWK